MDGRGDGERTPVVFLTKFNALSSISDLPYTWFILMLFLFHASWTGLNHCEKAKCIVLIARNRT